MSDDDFHATPLDRSGEADGRSSKDPRPCPVCGFAVPPSEMRCPRCRTLMIALCSGACTSCGSRTCLRGDDPA